MYVNNIRVTGFAVLFDVHFEMDTNIYCSFLGNETSKIAKRSKVPITVPILVLTFYIGSYMLCV